MKPALTAIFLALSIAASAGAAEPPPEDAAERVRRAIAPVEATQPNAPTLPAEPGYSSFDARMGAKKENGETETGIWFEVNLMRHVSPYVAAGMGAALWQTNNKIKTLSEGMITAVPVLIKLKIEDADLSFRPYLEAGAGYFFVKHDIDPKALVRYGPGVKIQESVDNAVGETLGAGVEFGSEGNSSFGLNVTYLSLKPNEQTMATDAYGGKIRSAQAIMNLSGPFATIYGVVRF